MAPTQRGTFGFGPTHQWDATTFTTGIPPLAIGMEQIHRAMRLADQDWKSSDISNPLQPAATNLPKNLENASRIRGRLVGGCKKNAERNAESG